MFYDKDNYLMSIPFITSCTIIEYDISKANISILLALGDISLDEYNKALNMDRMHRQIYVGLLQRDNAKINNDLKVGFRHYRSRFITENNLKQSDILSIKKDAIFVINKRPEKLIFDNYVCFTPKNTYSSYYKLLNLEVYYLLDQVSGTEAIDIKGIDDNKLYSHQYHMLEFLCSVFDMIQSRSPSDVILFLQKFGEKYSNRELDIEYYREFNADSKYRIDMNGTHYLLDFASESEKPYLNIYYNYTIIQELYKIATTLYFNSRRK